MESDPNLPHVEYEDIVPGQGILNKNLAEKRSYKTGILFEPGDVLYGKLRPYLMNWLYPQFKGIAVGDFWVLRPLDIDGSFLYRLIQNPDFQSVANVSAGSKMPRADWKLVSQREFAIPKDPAEQRKVGALFSHLDSLITLHQRKQGNVWHKNGAWNGLTNPLVFRTPLAASSPSCTPTVARMDAGDGADKAAAGFFPMAQTFVCAPGDDSAAEPSERPFSLAGDAPRPWG